MRTYTCDVCKVVTSTNPMRDRRLLQFEYMGNQYVVNLQFSQLNGRGEDICRQCQDDIVISIFKEDSVVEFEKDNRLGEESGPMPETERPMGMDMAYNDAAAQGQTSRRSR